MLSRPPFRERSSARSAEKPLAARASAEREGSCALPARNLDRPGKFCLDLAWVGAESAKELGAKPPDLRLPELGPTTHPKRLVGRGQPGLGLAGGRTRLEQDAHEQRVEAGSGGLIAARLGDDALDSRAFSGRSAAEDLGEAGEQVGDDPDLRRVGCAIVRSELIGITAKPLLVALVERQQSREDHRDRVAVGMPALVGELEPERTRALGILLLAEEP